MQLTLTSTSACTTKSPAAELGLLDETVSNEIIFELMLEHPVLVNRPIVCIPEGEHEKAVSLPLGRVEGIPIRISKRNSEIMPAK